MRVCLCVSVSMWAWACVCVYVGVWMCVCVCVCFCETSLIQQDPALARQRSLKRRVLPGDTPQLI